MIAERAAKWSSEWPRSGGYGVQLAFSQELAHFTQRPIKQRALAQTALRRHSTHYTPHSLVAKSNCHANVQQLTTETGARRVAIL